MSGAFGLDFVVDVDQPAWRAALATFGSYAVLLAVLFAVLFLVPYVAFLAF